MKKIIIPKILILTALLLSVNLITVFADECTYEENHNAIEEYLESLKNKYSGGDGTETNPYKISTIEDLMLMRNDSERNGSYGNDAITYFELTNDLVFNSDYANYKSWGDSAPANKLDCPNDKYAGKHSFSYAYLEGNGHTIYGLYGETNSLFNNTYDTTVKNLNFSHFYMKNSPLIAINISDSSYENINATKGNIVFKNRDYSNLHTKANGGLFDDISNTIDSTAYIKNVNVDINMTSDNGAYYIGMIAGCASSFSDCSTSGKFTIYVNKKQDDSDYYSFTAGCIAASGNGNIKNCSNKASVLIKLPASKNVCGNFAGIVGEMDLLSSSDSKDTKINQSINNCINEGNITVKTSYNLKVAKKQKGLRQNVSVAGIVSTIKDCLISDCTNKGKIKASYIYYLAGIVNTVNNSIQKHTINSKITNCLNEGSITSVATSQIAGICNTTDSDISHCENRGNLKTTEKMVDKNLFFISCSLAGIVGIVEVNEHDTLISYCKNTGHIEAYDSSLWASTSGIASELCQCQKNKYKGILSNCVNTGFIEGGMVSGIVNSTGSYKQYNYKGRNTIKNCINAGDLRHNYADDRIAGITFGSCYTDIKNCFNSGSISKKTSKGGTDRAAQLVSSNIEGSVIDNCYILKSDKSLYKATAYNRNGGKTKKVIRLSLSDMKKMSLYKKIMKNAGVKE